jgi:hypothetical protein
MVQPMTPLLLALVLCADSGPERLLESNVSAGVGVLGTSYTVFGARLGDAGLLPTVTARGSFGGFVIEGGAYVSTPLVRGGTLLTVTGGARVGFSGERWAVVAGVVAQVAPEATPALQLLPSLRAQLSFGQAGLSLGVFDHLGLVPAHLSVDLGPLSGRGRFSLGWVAPLGLIGSADVPVSSGFGLRVTGFAYRLNNVEAAVLLVSGTFGGTP